MSRLSELLSAVSDLDPRVGGELAREIKILEQRTSYGLMFERHRPEAVELPGHPARTGSKVRLLPPRGSIEKPDTRLWNVQRVRPSAKGTILEVVSLVEGEVDARTVPRNDVVVVAEFSDRIYPGLRVDETIQRSDHKPFHTVISGENFHVLEQLTFTHEHSVDAIYIDPPYNTGAKDWKYNNDYVVDDDHYRHSKWLAFMERRLKIAKRLLNPEDSVLIVSIDEKEYLRLGLLLEQTFPEARIQMISSVINPKGAARASAFARTDEYLYIVMFGSTAPASLPLPPDWKVANDARASQLRWAEAIRSGSNTRRADSPNQFYPVFVRNTPDGPVFDSVGEPYFGDDPSTVLPPEGCVAVWPIRSDGSEGNWQNGGAGMRGLIEKGYARLGRWRSERTAIGYLARGERAKVEDGTFPIVGRKQDGSIITDASGYVPRFVPGTQWRLSSHNAEQGGTNLLKTVLPGRAFPFPKSLFAVEDALRFFVVNKPNSVILDFFAGSGTTAHAVMRLNRQDGGRRQCISVTNNEVSADEQVGLRTKKLRPGDFEWEARGICDYITKPRIRAAITGETPDGQAIKGAYKFTDDFPISDGFEENAVFMTLTYESPWLVSNDRAFSSIAPMLWLRAGASGEMIRDLDAGWAVTQHYGIVRDLDQAAAFVDAVRAKQDLGIVFIVTDDEGRFQQVAAELPGVETVRLYAEYLRNCEITGDQA